LASLFWSFKHNFYERQGALLALGGLLLFSIAIRKNGDRKMRQLVFWGLGAMSLHFVLGRFGWFGRYEIYIWTVTAALLLYGFGDWLSDWVRKAGFPRAAVFLILLVLVTAAPYFYVTLQTPLGAANIYRQQFQMHRFVTEFHHGPVAVNDLGLVSWRNEYPVLDLWGLSNDAVRRSRLAGSGSRWLEQSVEKAGISLVMIYRDWFPEIPETWRPLADLYLGCKRVTAGGEPVTFYAADSTALPELRRELKEFAATLPAGTYLKWR
jgi:hypothetical protein